jgi:hypothetical protein
MQIVCGWRCALEYYKDQDLKRVKREKREGLLKIRPRREWMKLAQAAFNAFIRERDKYRQCISCDSAGPGDTRAGGFWDCGHYRTIGAAPELRFHELNAHKQCKTCNSGVRRVGKSVRAVHDPERYATIRAAYRERLIQRIGLENVEWLEGPHEPKKYTVAELRDLCTFYRLKLKALRQQLEFEIAS